MHRASNILNIGQGAIIIIVNNRGGQRHRIKGHSRLFNSIRISLVPGGIMESPQCILQCFVILNKGMGLRVGNG